MANPARILPALTLGISAGLKSSLNKRSLLIFSAYCAFCGIVGAGDFSYPQGVYNGEEVERATLDNGGKVNKAFLEKMAFTTAVKPEIV